MSDWYIESGKTDKRVYFHANSGLSSFSVDGAKNADSFTAFTTPTVTELGSTGVYSVLVDEQTTITGGEKTEPLTLLVSAAGMATQKIDVIIYIVTV